MSRTNDEGSAPRPLRDKRGLVNRVRRLRGQVDAIVRALDGEASFSDLLQRITAARGATNGPDGRGFGRTRLSVAAEAQLATALRHSDRGD